ncbi:MAG: replication initiation protein [Alteromonadaceae bacterium]|nr:replication initiation protein [Alteromonadaceae bacterium]
MVTIEELRTILSVEKNQYKLVGHLKSRLLIPTINLINKVTDIKVSFEEDKA